MDILRNGKIIEFQLNNERTLDEWQQESPTTQRVFNLHLVLFVPTPPLTYPHPRDYILVIAL